MNIEIHCPGCSKLIRAPEDAGGKSGKCPYCGRKVYIPMPADDEDVIPLAPIDPEDEERDRALRQESAKYAANVDHADARGISAAKSGGPPASAPGKVVDVEASVKRYIACMHASRLDEAERIAGDLKSAGSRAKDVVQSLMLDELPVKVDNVPPPLVTAFLKNLSSRLE